MKKLLFTLALMLVTLTANAQCNCNHEPVRYWYICAILVSKEIKYYDGSEDKVANSYLDDNGNKVYVKNGKGLVNYLTLQGWEFLREENSMYYLRKAVSDKEANNILPKLINQNK